MARNKFRGDALPVAQVRSVTVTAAGAAGDAPAVTINGKAVAYTLETGDSPTMVAAGLAAALSESSVPAEFREVVWTSVGPVLTGTASEPGRPFTFGVTADGTTTFGSPADSVGSSGPNHWDDPTNWTLGAVPVSTDDVDLADCAVDILYGIDQNAVTLASLNIDSTFTGKVGLPPFNGDYFEYRTTDLKIGATAVTIGGGTGSGSSRVRLDLGAAQSTILVAGTGSPAGAGIPTVYLKGTHASNALTVTGGVVGLAFELGTSATVLTLGVAAGPGSPPQVFGGRGLTLGTLNVQAGAVALTAGLTTCNQDGGVVTLGGPQTCNVTTLNLRGGTFYPDAPGTITTATLSGGTLDFGRDPRAKTVTNCTANAGSTLNDPDKRVTFTNPVSFPDGLAGPGGSGGATANLGKQISLARS